MPADAELRFTDSEWTNRIRYFVAIQDQRFEMVPGHVCACKHDFNEHHAENCKLRGHFTKRSDKINLILLEEAWETNHLCKNELPISTNQKGEKSNGRIDGVCEPMTASGRIINFDGTIVSPSGQAVVSKNGRLAGYAVQQAEDEKNDNGYLPHFSAIGQDYIGIAMSTAGFFGTCFTRFRRRLHKGVANKDQHHFDAEPGTNPNSDRRMVDMSWSLPTRYTYYTARLACGLQKALNRMTNEVYDANIDYKDASSRNQRRRHTTRAYNDPHNTAAPTDTTAPPRPPRTPSRQPANAQADTAAQTFPHTPSPTHQASAASVSATAVPAPATSGSPQQHSHNVHADTAAQTLHHTQPSTPRASNASVSATAVPAPTPRSAAAALKTLLAAQKNGRRTLSGKSRTPCAVVGCTINTREHVCNKHSAKCNTAGCNRSVTTLGESCREHWDRQEQQQKDQQTTTNTSVPLSGGSDTLGETRLDGGPNEKQIAGTGGLVQGHGSGNATTLHNKPVEKTGDITARPPAAASSEATTSQIAADKDRVIPTSSPNGRMQVTHDGGSDSQTKD